MIFPCSILKFKTKKGRIVYGGGGITPDVFVPYEGKHGEEATMMILQSGVISFFAFEQLDKNRNFFNKLSRVDLKKEILNQDKCPQKNDSKMLKQIRHNYVSF